MVQNQWYHVEIGAPPMLVSFSGNWDVHWGLTGLLTHGHVTGSGDANPRPKSQRKVATAPSLAPRG